MAMGIAITLVITRLSDVIDSAKSHDTVARAFGSSLRLIDADGATRAGLVMLANRLRCRYVGGNSAWQTAQAESVAYKVSI